jgi:hypothetical protein
MTEVLNANEKKERNKNLTVLITQYGRMREQAFSRYDQMWLESTTKLSIQLLTTQPCLQLFISEKIKSPIVSHQSWL